MAKYLKKSDWGEYWADLDITTATLVRKSFEVIAGLGLRFLPARDEQNHPQEQADQDNGAAATSSD